jgi:two-component system CheB/CheR fusion protein
MPLQPRDGGVVSEERSSEDLAGLVVIGASAGGIDALSEVLGPLGPSFPAPIVVAQHTQPSRASHLAEILGRRTNLAVATVEGQESLRPATVYVVPSDHHVVITDHMVEAQETAGDRPSPSIDRLLASAAEIFGERLIAVILSGMGTDGVAGASEVKAHGGTVVIQNPETAAQPAMPRALPPTIVDFVANADRMGELLTELAGSAAIAQPEDDERLLGQFLERVRERTGIDFAAYKRPTVMRRLHRRMVATSSPRLRDYVRYVQRHPEEYHRLSSTFLIKVTQFFRDTDLFEHLRTALLPTLIQEARGRGRELRLWSAGCATGEEAYSLAILVAEALGAERESFTVRIFATDLDEEAVSFARRGFYPASSLSAMKPDLVKRYFMLEGDHYEVTKDIRSTVVFGQHDLGQRAPFPRIDLALCRNVLIYFTPELQKRALQLFAFSLREGGFLVLGKAESSTPYAEHFVLEQPRLKIYRRVGERVLIPPARIRDTAPLPVIRPSARREPQWATLGAGPRAMRDLALQGGERLDHLLLRLPIGVVVIDPEYDISFLNAAARRLLGIHGAAIGSDFIHLAHRLPSDDLRAAVAAAVRGETQVITRPLLVEGEDPETSAYLQLTLEPYRQSNSETVESVLVTVIDVSESIRERQALELEIERGKEDRRRVEDRIDRLDRSNRELLQANEEMTNANAILRTTNEELVVANEEVQAATEEVETLNEELQATNEELETLNEELQATVEELNTTNDDLEARSTELTDTAASLAEQRQRSELERERVTLILDGMGEAVLVVDHEGRAVGTNRVFVEGFGQDERGLVPEDGAGAALPDAEWPQARVARGETFSMSFTRLDPATGERRWYEASGRGTGGELGGVIVIRDITDRSLRHLQERFIDTASHELKTPVAAIHTYLQLVARETDGSLDGQGAVYLRGAIEESRHLGELAERLFDVSLIRHGHLVVRREPVDLAALVREVVEEAKLMTPAVRIRGRDVRGPLVVDGDALRLRQLLTNLLTNAVTHGASRRGIDVSLVADDGRAVVRIADRGPGLPALVRAHLFTPFLAGTSVEGMGLGLYLSQAIAVEHGGTLAIEQRAGGGTEAVLGLPLAAERAVSRPGGRRKRSAGEAP